VDAAKPYIASTLIRRSLAIAVRELANQFGGARRRSAIDPERRLLSPARVGPNQTTVQRSANTPMVKNLVRLPSNSRRCLMVLEESAEPVATSHSTVRCRTATDGNSKTTDRDHD
jgi:hypothetical protein